MEDRLLRRAAAWGEPHGMTRSQPRNVEVHQTEGTGSKKVWGEGVASSGEGTLGSQVCPSAGRQDLVTTSS